MSEPHRVFWRLQLLRRWSSLGTAKKYSPEGRTRAVRMVFDHQGEHDWQWAAIRSIAVKIGCPAESLRHWVRQAERDAGLPTTGRDELKRLQRENRELKRANDILRMALHLLPRRSSAAEPDDGVVHRRATRLARSRSDLQATADRFGDVLRAQSSRSGSETFHLPNNHERRYFKAEGATPEAA